MQRQQQTQRQSQWWLYMLCCADGSFYTGITTSVLRRLREHNESPRAARYTRARRPLTLVLAAPAGDRAEASRLEAAIKALSRADKQRLLASWSETPPCLYIRRLPAATKER